LCCVTISGVTKPAPYDEFSADYARHAATNPFQSLYDRPAMLALAGEVTGYRVLDVGCAAGHLTAELARRGADVLGIDLSQGMVDLARDEFGALAEFRQADLAQPLDFVQVNSVDLITASLVLHYLREWGPTLAEFRRVLRPGGAVIASVHHPEDWHWFEGTHYFDTELLTDEWTMAGRPRKVSFYRRPLSATFAALRQAGFQVDQLVEPRPLSACETEDPRAYQILTGAPRFLYFRLVNPD
jgi:SAM-dependent methyltransferase